MTNKNLETLSAVLDDETNSSELDHVFTDLGDDSKATFSRYSMIGDVLRNEQHIALDSAFSANIQAAIADVEQEQVEVESEQAEVVAISSHPSWFNRAAAMVTSFGSSSTGKGMGQMAIAASVALVAVFGVSNMTPQDDNMPSPVLSTTPLIDGISPVSADGLKSKPSANQVTQKRINALMADHNQQLRVAEDEELEKDKEQDDKP